MAVRESAVSYKGNLLRNRKKLLRGAAESLFFMIFKTCVNEGLDNFIQLSTAMSRRLKSRTSRGPSQPMFLWYRLWSLQRAGNEIQIIHTVKSSVKCSWQCEIDHPVLQSPQQQNGKTRLVSCFLCSLTASSVCSQLIKIN